jgi:hypothetical protein
MELGQLALGLDFTRDMAVRNRDARLELTGSIAGILSSTSGSGYAALVVPEYEGRRAKIKLGANYRSANGSEFSVSAFYDGIGTRKFEDFGLQARIELTF